MELKTIIAGQKFGRKMQTFNEFLRRNNKKRRFWKLGGKCLLFTTIGVMICPNLVVPHTISTSLLVQNFIYSIRVTKFFSGKSATNWLEDLRWCLHVKLSLTRLLFASPQTFPSLFFGLVQANFPRILCVRPCPQDFIKDTNMTRICKDSSTKKTRLETLKRWSGLIFIESELIVKLRASTPQEFQ